MTDNTLNVEPLAEQLERLADHAQSIASAGVCAAGGSLAKSIRSVSPAPLHDYIGFRQIRSSANRIRLVVGFGHGRKSRKRTRSKPPTPAQTQRLAQFVRTGVQSGMPTAMSAMQRATEARIQAILKE